MTARGGTTQYEEAKMTKPTDKEVEQFAAALDRMFEQRPGTGFGVVRTQPDIERRLVCLEPLGFFFEYARAKDAALSDQAKMTPGERMVWTRPDYTMVSGPYAWVIAPMTPAQWLAARARNEGEG
jgi:hypothetical protein